MRKSVLLALCLALLAAGVLFACLRIVSLSERVRALEQRQHPIPVIAPAVRRRTPPPDHSLHKVLRVIDGDTFVMDANGGPLKVRVLGIDTPETVHPDRPVEPFGPEASRRARELLAGKPVTIHYDADLNKSKWGKYGRLLVYVELPDTRDFGSVLIREGLARAYRKYPCSRLAEYIKAEREAQAARVGVWRRPTTQMGRPATGPASMPIAVGQDGGQ